MSVTDAPVAPSTSIEALDEKIDRLSAHVDYLVTETRRQAELIDMIGELVHDAAPLATDAMQKVVTQLAAIEEAGYLDALREIAQPELLALLQDMVAAVRIEQRAVADEPAAAPSLWALARRTRDPEVRRGLARALDTLRVVSVTTTEHPVTGRPDPNRSRT